MDMQYCNINNANLSYNVISLSTIPVQAYICRKKYKAWPAFNYLHTYQDFLYFDCRFHIRRSDKFLAICKFVYWASYNTMINHIIITLK